MYPTTRRAARPFGRIWLASLLALVSMASKLQAQTRYTLSFSNPNGHLIDVEARFEGGLGRQEVVNMPVWTPGSYLIREYAKNIETLSAFDDAGQPIVYERLDKASWRVDNAGKPFRVRYRIYCNELTVRTAHVDGSHAFITPAPVLVYVKALAEQTHTGEFNLPQGWTTVSTPLTANGKASFTAANLDQLMDSPFEVGSHQEQSFEREGVRYRLATYPATSRFSEKQIGDIADVVQQADRVFGPEAPPLKEYLFISHLAGGGGGLEHLYASVLQGGPTVLTEQKPFTDFLSLVAHEYFHLWNVKRIRPIALGPFNYDEENYTRMLWLSEGGTEYFSNLIVQRAGFLTPDAYLADISNGITRVENTPGNKQQSAAESSFDAWIKYYRPNENSANTSISYYDKGELIGVVLDLMVIQETKGQKSLDDVMRYLYDEYYIKKQRGFTDEEYQAAVARIAGRRFDDFFRRHVYGTETLPYNTALGYAGLKLATTPISEEATLGASVSTSGSKYTVTNTLREGSAWQGGLNVNDELLALNGTRVTDDPNKLLAGLPAGTEVKLLVSRDGVLKELSFPLLAGTAQRYRIERLPTPTAEQQTVLNKWLVVRK